MNKNISILIVLIALFFAGWILYEGNAFPFIAPMNQEVPGESENVSGSATTTSALGKCYVGGCSAQICSDEEGVMSTCEFRPEYSCYQGAKCERQVSGQCGWTLSAELNMCLQNASL